MRVGLLDRRLTIQQKSIAQDGSGQAIETWTDLITVWGQIRPDRGSERFMARQIIGKAVMTFIVRFRTGITVLNRILFNDQIYDIHDVRIIGRKRMLEIDATARSEP